jgi:thiamine-phosphate pyrophosphorylase
MIADDLAVYLVTSQPAGESTVRLVAEAVAGGVRVVQLRDKTMTTRERITVLHRLRDAVPEAILIVNDDAAAAAAVPGVGVHVGPDDHHPSRVRGLVGPDVVVGWSIHDRDQLEDREALQAADYVAASPVWPTPTKIDTGVPWGLDGVTELRAGLPPELPLVGIGGISADNAGRVIEAGADGVAVVSAIGAAADPRSAAARLVSVVRQVRGRP